MPLYNGNLSNGNILSLTLPSLACQGLTILIVSLDKNPAYFWTFGYGAIKNLCYDRFRMEAYNK